jgi:hypothetical protein
VKVNGEDVATKSYVYSVAGSKASDALNQAKSYVNSKLNNYATKSYVYSVVGTLKQEILNKTKKVYYIAIDGWTDNTC